MDSRISLARRVLEASKLSGTFKLRSGAVSDTYFDKYLFESDPLLLKLICEQMALQVPAETEILAGLEMGGIPVVTMLSHVTGIPAAFIRKSAKSYGTCKYAEGPDLVGKNITIIEDVVSSGGAIIEALDHLAQDGIHPISVLCVIDRQTGGSENLKSRDHQLHSVFTMEDIEGAT